MNIDLEISQKAVLRPIGEVAKSLHIAEEDVIPYGKYMAKIPLSYIQPEKIDESSLILVSAITPTPAGEGKTTTSLGLVDGLNAIGVPTVGVLREPSLGPVFGLKGGATGGGYAQMVPMEDINLHCTGDFSALEKAHNLLSALIDHELQKKNPFVHIDAKTITWKRVMDMNDRTLRKIIIGLGGEKNGIPRESGFDITVASEVMAILCFAQNYKELKERLGNIYIAKTISGDPVYAKDIKAHGAMAVLLKNALLPNLVQTLEGNPVLVHGGPFANIAQGTNTLIATQMGMSLQKCVVTEAGFAFDLGGEKFLNMKCRMGNLKPKIVVLVATIRALKWHGGVPKEKLSEENVNALKKGCANLQKHYENAVGFGLNAIVAVNIFPTDTEEEKNELLQYGENHHIIISLSDVWAKGGAGAKDLAEKVHEILKKTPPKPLAYTYPLQWTIEQKIEAIAQKIYGATGVQYTPKAKADIERITKLGYGDLPICMAKTQYSLSDDPQKINRPDYFFITIREIELASGAGFIIPLAGDIVRMPGLPEHPASENIDLDEYGNISGLF